MTEDQQEMFRYRVEQIIELASDGTHNSADWWYDYPPGSKTTIECIIDDIVAAAKEIFE